MGNFSRTKVFRLAKGFKGRGNSCYGIAIRKVHKKLKYQYRDRRMKKRIVRRNWIVALSAATREHGMNYSRFIMCLNRSNIEIDRKILADIAVHEPYSFKCVIDEVKKQNKFSEFEHTTKKQTKQRGMLLEEALENGRLKAGGPPTAEELLEIQAALLPPKLNLYGLRYPERDAKTDADYMRISYQEEDAKFMAD